MAGKGQADPPANCTEACVLYRYVQGSEADVEGPKYLPRSSLNQAIEAERLYTPLADWQMRILTLYPGLTNDSIKTALRLAAPHYSDGCILLGDNVKIQYEALSYHWGAPRFDCEIFCNDVTYPVTKTIYNALWYLRDPNEIRYLWIDALCVNQNNLVERSVQVAKMLSIYRNAERVTVWLGTSTSGIALLDRFYAWKSEMNNAWMPSSKEMAHELCNEHDHALTLGLYDLLTRPWYKRLWVKQEIWAAIEVQIICGSCTFEWDRLDASARAETYKLTTYDHFFRNPFELFNKMMEKSSNLQPVSPQTTFRHSLLPERHHDDERIANYLLQILQRTSSSECSDPRDHVYAILGMTKIAHKPVDTVGWSEVEEDLYFPIDYNQSIREIYIDVVRLFIKTSRSFYVLEQVGMGKRADDSDPILGGYVGDEYLPSWCPNWSVAWEFAITDPGERAWNQIPLDVPQSPLLKSSTTLYLRGVQVAKVVISGYGNQYSPVLERMATRSASRDELIQGALRSMNSLETFQYTGKPIANDMAIAAHGFYFLVLLRLHLDSTKFEFVGILPHRASTFGDLLQDDILQREEDYFVL